MCQDWEILLPKIAAGKTALKKSDCIPLLEIEVDETR